MAVSWGGHGVIYYSQMLRYETRRFQPCLAEHRQLRLYCGLEDAVILLQTCSRHSTP